MKIKPRDPLSPKEVEDLQKRRQELEAKAAKEKTLGSLTAKPNVKRDRFYLPVLHINDPTMWESQPLENRLHFTDKVAYSVCVGNCCGVSGLKAGCCYLDPDDLEHVLGPLDEAWISQTVKWFRKQGIMMTRADLVIEFEEGRLIADKFFTSHRKQVFFEPTSYPMLRFQVDGPRFACKFLNGTTGKCTIYQRRPSMCQEYACQYVKANFLVRTPSNPNTYKKLR